MLKNLIVITLIFLSTFRLYLYQRPLIFQATVTSLAKFNIVDIFVDMFRPDYRPLARNPPMTGGFPSQELVK